VHKPVLPLVARKLVDAVSSTEPFHRAEVLALQTEVPTTSASTVASNPDPTVVEEC
jgi:hypothetical protein